VYLDAGFPAAKDLILRLWNDRIHTVKQDARDAKTALQEWAQARGFPPPAYVQTDRQGPDHAPLFTIRVQIENGHNAVAVAPSKRQAEQSAAKMLLAQLEKNS
ncbi:MAG: ribonuclease III family protein, partial [Sulfitobacter sp.]